MKRRCTVSLKPTLGVFVLGRGGLELAFTTRSFARLVRWQSSHRRIHCFQLPAVQDDDGNWRLLEIEEASKWRWYEARAGRLGANPRRCARTGQSVSAIRDAIAREV